MDVSEQELVEMARDAKENAYSPYSEYSVGCVVLTEDDSFYTGCNIENITFDMCSHAERTALRTAIAEGHQDFKILAISTEGQNGEPPCGTCRQFIAEFCEDDFRILSDDGDSVAEYTIGEIFPQAFRPQAVEEET